MSDQAARLREIAVEVYGEDGAGKYPARQPGRSAKVIAVTSGKGGVGKTNIAVNLAMKLREYDSSVLLIDTDFNLANADILMGISPQTSLVEAILNRVPVSEVIHTGPGGIHFLPGGSGIAELLNQQGSADSRLIRQLSELEKQYDYLILDTPAGLTKQTLDYLTYASQVYVVATPEPTSIADAYAMVKMLHLQQRQLPVYVLMNMVKTEDSGKEIFRKFKLVVDRFLKIKVYYLGSVVSDKNIGKAVLEQKPLVKAHPKSPAAKCLGGIAERIVLGGRAGKSVKTESFFEKLGKISIFH